LLRPGLKPLLLGVEGSLINVDLLQILNVPLDPLGCVANVISVDVIEGDVGSLEFSVLAVESLYGG